MEVIVDTNALILSAKFRVDLFSELNRLGYDRVLAPKAIVRELMGLSKDLKGLEKKAADLSLLFLERCEILDIDGNADEIILELAKERGAAVFTNDKELKRKLKKEGIDVIILRQKKYLSPDKFGKL